MTLYIGIDPGKTGGIVAVSGEGIRFASKLPETEGDTYELLHGICRDSEQVFVVIEQVHAMPGKVAGGKRVSMGATSAFTFGRGYGFLRGCLTALAVPWEECPPQRWQKAMHCLTKGDKNVSKAMAQRLWPCTKWTHATADAALIAEYNRRVRTGQIQKGGV